MSAETSYQRSAKIRQRKNQRSQDRVTRAASYARSGAMATPSVTVRGQGMGRPILTRASTQPRRKFYVSLDTVGAEISMPAIPMIRPGWRLISGILVVGMVMMIFLLNNAPAFTVKSTRVTGLQRLTLADVEAVLDLNGKSIVTVDPDTLKTKLREAFPELSAVSVGVWLPSGVSIAVRERQPVLAWKSRDVVTWIDSEGAMFSPRGDAGSLLTVASSEKPPLGPTLIPVSGSTSAAAAPAAANPASQRVDTQVITAAAILATQMPAESSMVYSTSNGLGWTDPRGWQVYFGLNLDNIAEKLTLYQAIVDQLTQKGIKPAVISVENVYAPFYRLEP
jgi:cell division septal protein FtsQ